jgi:hypothetical protein
VVVTGDNSRTTGATEAARAARGATSPPFRLRALPPVLSPLSASALVRAAAAGAAASSCPRLHDLLRDRYSADRVVLTDSGTHALQLALTAALSRSSAGQRIVALPAYCCYDVATAAVGANARIALYDVDPDTLAPDAASLEQAFRAGARAAVIAPLYGVPAAWSPLESIAAQHGALLIEDAAQGHGAQLDGRVLGSIGQLSVLSFGRGKGWTGGAGGALLARGDAPPIDADGLAEGTGGIRTWMAAAAQWLLARPSLYGVPSSLPFLGLGETHYRQPSPAASMPGSVAALILATRDPSPIFRQTSNSGGRPARD